jgi:hypothetical protein
VGHGADEVEVRDIDVLAGSGVEALPKLVLVAGPGADDYDSDIGGGGGGDSSGETGLVGGPALAALGEGGGWCVLVGSWKRGWWERTYIQRWRL